VDTAYTLRHFKLVLILAGMAIYGYLASAVVESIAHGVLTGAMAERRRRRMIERTTDHYIICGVPYIDGSGTGSAVAGGEAVAG
jgi:hypothetical protein